MKYEPINKELFVKNRAKFTAQMQPKSIAFFNSNDIYPISADSTLPFQQHRDLFYLSGVDQEESVLFLCPECPKEAYREILFVRETDAHVAVWEGKKLSKETASNVSGVATVLWLSDLEKVLAEMMRMPSLLSLASSSRLLPSITAGIGIPKC